MPRAGRSGSDRGPSLAVPTFVHGNTDADLFRSVRAGIRGTQMPSFSGLSDTAIWQLVAFVRTLQPATRGDGSQAPSIGDAATGQTLFFGRAGCANCHEVNGRGGIVGPDLSNAGRLPEAALHQVIVDPGNPSGLAGRGSRGRASGGAVRVIMKDGREIRGVRRNEDTFSLQMVDESGQLQLLDKLTAASVTDIGTLHPRDYGVRFSGSEIADLVAYLRQQNARDLRKTADAPPVPGGVTYERLVKASTEPQNWLMYWGDYQGTHYSRLDQIKTSNVARLRPAWSAPVPGDAVSESTPLVVDGVFTHQRRQPSNSDRDRRTDRPADLAFCASAEGANPGETDVVNRGVAILGHRLFVGTNDAALLCLDARTGLLLWEVQVADTMEGFNITSPPLIVKDKIIVGHAGGEYAIRGFLDAYDVTGEDCGASIRFQPPASREARHGRVTAGKPAAAERG